MVTVNINQPCADRLNGAGVELTAALADNAAAVQIGGYLVQAEAIVPHVLDFGNDKQLLIDRHQLAVLILIAEARRNRLDYGLV